MTGNLDILEEIKRNNIREYKVNQAWKRKYGLTWEQDGIVYIEGQIYIPNNKRLKEQILQKNHNPVDVGHPGQQRMIKLVKIHYWWLGLKEDIKKYMQGCIKCQQNKVQHQQKPGELHPLEIPQRPWQEICINIIGPLPRSNGMNTIVVIVD